MWLWKFAGCKDSCWQNEKNNKVLNRVANRLFKQGSPTGFPSNLTGFPNKVHSRVLKGSTRFANRIRQKGRQQVWNRVESSQKGSRSLDFRNRVPVSSDLPLSFFSLFHPFLRFQWAAIWACLVHVSKSDGIWELKLKESFRKEKFHPLQAQSVLQLAN